MGSGPVIEAALSLNANNFNKTLNQAVGDVKGLGDAAKRASKDLTLDLNTKLFDKKIANVQNKLKSLSNDFTRVGQQAGVAFLGGAAAIGGLSKVAKDFETGMRSVSTLVDTSTESMAVMQKQVLDIARVVPVGIGDLTSALYDVRSAGIDAGSAMATLEASAKLSVAGLSTAKEATNIMTSALNAFAADGLSASETADVLFKTVKYGKTTIAELAQSFGSTAPIVASVGVSLKDFSAATAALTTVGLPASQAQTQLRAAITALINPTKEMDKLFTALGVTSGVQLINSSKNLGDTFTKLYSKSQELGINFAKASSSVEAFNAIQSIATTTNLAYAKTFKDITGGADALEEAYAKMVDPIDQATNSVKVLAVELGQALLPTFRNVATALQGVTKYFSDLPQPVKAAIANTLLFGTALTGLVATIGLVGGAVLNGVSTLVSLGAGFVKVAGFIKKTLVPALEILAVVSEAVLGISTGGLAFLVAGVVTAVAGLAIAWANNWGNIQNITKQAVSFMGLLFQDFGKFVVDVFNGLINSIKPFAVNLLKAVGSAFAGISNVASAAFGNMVAFAQQAFNSILNGLKYMLIGIKKGLVSIVDATNSVLKSVGAPTVNFRGFVTDVKSATNQVTGYFTSKWKQAGINVQATLNKAVQGVASTSASSFKPASVISRQAPKFDSPDPEKAIGSGGKKKGAKTKKAAKTDAQKAAEKAAKKAEQDKKKRQREATKAANIAAKELRTEENNAVTGINDALGKQITDNQLNLDESIAGLGAYADEGEKLSKTLVKLQQDEQALIATRTKLQGLKVSGDAEQKRLQLLDDIGNKVRQNAIDQENIDNNLARLGAENYKKRIEEYARLQDAKTHLSQRQAELENGLLKKQEDYQLASLKKQLDDKQISQQEYVDQTSAIYNQQAEREIANNNLIIEGIQNKIAQIESENGITAESIALQERKLELETQNQEIQLQTQEIINQTRESLEENKTLFEEFATTIGGAVDQFANNFVQSILSGNASISDSFKALGVQILQGLAKDLFSSAKKGFLDLIKQGSTTTDILTKGFKGFAIGAGKIFSGFGSIVASVFGSMLKTSISVIGKMFAATKSASIANAIVQVHEWAIAAAKSVAGIPFVGPGLAAAAYAAALGLGLTGVAAIKAVQLVGFEVGTPEISQDMIAQVHQGEMIIPKSFADAIRSGDVSLSGGRSQGGNTQESRTITINFAGAQFVGAGDEMIDQIEAALLKRKNTIGSALFGT